MKKYYYVRPQAECLLLDVDTLMAGDVLSVIEPNGSDGPVITSSDQIEANDYALWDEEDTPAHGNINPLASNLPDW